jgi:hypothetical protein
MPQIFLGYYKRSECVSVAGTGYPFCSFRMLKVDIELADAVERCV